MRYLLFSSLIFVCTCINLYGQTTYYLASDGNDNNLGTSQASPVRSLTKASLLPLVAGDQLLLRRGDTFRGILKINQSGTPVNPIKISAYGVGNPPVISASVLVTNWVSLGNNKWQASCPDCGTVMTGLYINSISQPLGRYPNENELNRGYLTIQSHTGKSILGSLQGLATNWVGAEVVTRSKDWILDRSTVTQQNSSTLTLNSNSVYDLVDGAGFFIQDHPATLNQNGEWFYDKNNKSLVLYYNLGNPNNQNITATALDYGIYALSQSNVIIDNVHVTQSVRSNLFFIGVTSFSVTNSSVTNSGENAVYFAGTGSSIIFQNNLISKTNNNAFQVDQYNNFIFRNNTIRNTATEPGRGKSGDAQYIGLQAYSTNTTIENNTFDSLGYHGIISPKSNVIIRRNKVSNFCVTKSDGGGIYIWNGVQEPMNNVLFEENIIFNGVGAPDGTVTGFRGTNGIYLDECVSNVTVRGNTVFKCYLSGVYLHDTHNIIVEGNTCFDNGRQFYLDQTAVCTSYSNVVQNNTFVAKQTTQLTAQYDAYSTNLGTFGAFNNNYYVRPLDDVQTLQLSYPPPNGNLFDPQTLNEWQTKYGKDLNSKKSPTILKDYVLNGFTGSERVVGGDFTTGTGYGSGGPFIFSDFGNGQGTWDNNNRINGGALNLNFSTVTNNVGASLYVGQVINSVSKDKDYIVSFDAVSTTNNRVLQIYMQPQFPPFNGILTETRLGAIVGTTNKHYEFSFRPIRDEANALLILRVFESNQPLYIDNLSLREANVSKINPDTLMQLIYNPTNRDSLITINGGFIDSSNQPYYQQILLSPFKSIALFRSTLPTVDLALSLQTSKRTPKVNEDVTYQIKIYNNNTNSNTYGVQAVWTSQLPPNLEFSGGTGVAFSSGVVSGTVSSLSMIGNVTFNFQVRPLIAGTYRTAVQIARTNLPDSNSIPGSGTSDGEDDTAETDIRTREFSNSLFVSPNPNPRILPTIVSSQPVPDPNKADLSLQIAFNKRNPVLSEVVTCTITLRNSGGAPASGIKVQNKLPDGLQFVNSSGWLQSGSILTSNIITLNANSTTSLIFQAKVINTGRWINQSQILSSGITDPDSTPGNGFLNGEDDESQIDILTRQ
jgi:uncharacterized repeat protein (TIGR01451 family)